jgi:uncharacterized protein with HEPN domain
MTNRLPKHLFDAVAAGRLALRFRGSLALEAYAADVLVRSAVERQLEILGEAARRILDEEPELRERIPGLALALGLRNRLIHGYDKVNHAIVFDTVERDLPELTLRLQELLDRFELPGPLP